MKKQFKAHPWHGIPSHSSEGTLNAFIEIVPTDNVKYEIDKESGYLMIDRPQKFSNIVPSLYGFIPSTYCGDEVAEYCSAKTGKEGIVGDADPLDICVLTERQVPHGDILVRVIPIGGFRMIDGGEADDKIIAVLANDEIFKYRDVSECPDSLINRLKHYFLTYKELPGQEAASEVEITDVYNAKEALEIIKRSEADYKTLIG